MSLEPGPSRPLLYQQLAAQIAAAIDSGALRAGDRAPSVRKLSVQHGVSVSTVLQAYAHLEAEGLLRARPQSGHYVRGRPSLPEIRPSRTPREASPVSVSSLVAGLYSDAHQDAAVQFGAAYTPFSFLPTRRLGRLLAAAARDSEHAGAEYDLPPGNPALRRQVARRSVEWGCALAPEDFIVTCGATEALNLCLLAVARRGDTVAIESPTFFGILQMLEAHGLRALEIPCDAREGMRLDALEAGLKRHRIAAVIAVPNFSNPLGSVMSDASKEKLVELLARRDVPLIEDDTFGDLHHGPTRPKVAKAFDRRGLVLLCGSFSKTLAPGYRVGWVAAGKFQERVQLLKFSQNIATTTLQQRALAAFLEAGGYDRHLRTLRRRLAGAMNAVAAGVERHFPPGTRMTQPTGGTVLWLELPGRANALTLYERALAEGISLAPGPIFSPRGRYERFVRLSTALEWSDEVDAALARVGAIARDLV
ncbi:aminotransferase-like domain-containing protein [Anaeromyxobacter oryzisoli]|uniref:aminotransferase-like domain-containing protein n=1 Tax=Anaeromyxobacter oryzisoli TaxID=2925408 RepID=UPI001F5987AC|nr:PLP-dependent aminotransferase family protein [Anaeromyxobacter sp. SG63]